MHNQLLSHKGDLYVIKRIIKETTLKPVEDLTFLKEYYRSDLILKKDGRLIFVEKIEDAQIVEEDNLKEE